MAEKDNLHRTLSPEALAKLNAELARHEHELKRERATKKAGQDAVSKKGR